MIAHTPHRQHHKWSDDGFVVLRLRVAGACAVPIWSSFLIWGGRGHCAVALFIQTLNIAALPLGDLHYVWVSVGGQCRDPTKVSTRSL